MKNDHTTLIPTCREVHRLTSEGLDRPLSLVERGRMVLHRLVCAPCRAFHDQMLLLRQAMHKMSRGEPGDPGDGKK